jgi:hypothetical protein
MTPDNNRKNVAGSKSPIVFVLMNEFRVSGYTANAKVDNSNTVKTLVRNTTLQ